jgi:hypothetical protein
MLQEEAPGGLLLALPQISSKATSILTHGGYGTDEKIGCFIQVIRNCVNNEPSVYYTIGGAISIGPFNSEGDK